MKFSLQLLTALFFTISFSLQGSEIDSLLQLLHSGDVQQKAKTFNRIARLYYYTQPDSTIIYAKQALKEALRTDDAEEKYEAYLHIGVGYSILGNNIKAIENHLPALDIASGLDDNEKLARIYNEIGIDYQYSLNFEKSLEYFLQALTIYEEVPESENGMENKKRIAYVKSNIGVLFDQLGDFDNALEYQLSNYELCKQIGDNEGAVSALINIGVVFQEKGQNDKALGYFEKAKDKSIKNGYISYLATALANLAILHTELKSYKIALQESEEALKQFTATDDKRNVLVVSNNIANLYLKLDDKQQAFYYLTKALELGAGIEASHPELNTYRLLSLYYYNAGDYKKAFETRKIFDTKKDSLFTKEIADKVTEMQTKYETESKLREIKILQSDNEIKSLKIKQKSNQVYLFAILMILAILFLMVMILLFNRRRLKQKKTEAELEKSRLQESRLQERTAYQSKQLTTHALNMLQKNKLLMEMDNELKTFTPKAEEKLMKSLSRIRRQIKQNMNSERDWDLFKLYFEEVNENFFKTLHEKCKTLTTGDLKLAALIKLNLNIKEAAAVLNISPESLRKARYRLRKKLGLFERENLFEYLNNI